MKIKVTVAIKDYDGKPITTKDESGVTKEITLRKMISDILNTATADEAQGKAIMMPEMKTKIFQISQKVFASNTPDFTIDELALIKERAGLVATPHIYGVICEAIEAKPEEPTKPDEKPAE